MTYLCELCSRLFECAAVPASYALVTDVLKSALGRDSLSLCQSCRANWQSIEAGLRVTIQEAAFIAWQAARLRAKGAVVSADLEPGRTGL